MLQGRFPGFGMEIDDAFGNWFSGFVDGEGSFILSPQVREKLLPDGATYTWRSYGAVFSLGLRLDDLPLLAKVRKTLGCGHIDMMSRTKVSNPSARYRVSDCDDMQCILVPFFTQFPLRSKKKGDFEIWREGIAIAYKSKHSRSARAKGSHRVFLREWDRYVEIAERLKAHREFETSVGQEFLDLPLRPVERKRLGKLLTKIGLAKRSRTTT